MGIIKKMFGLLLELQGDNKVPRKKEFCMEINNRVNRKKRIVKKYQAWIIVKWKNH